MDAFYDLSLTGEGLTDIELNSLIVDSKFQNTNASYFNNITSNIQDQINTLSSNIVNNSLLA